MNPLPPTPTPERQPPPELPTLPYHPTIRDWIEDTTHENGNYLCLCTYCDSQFHGHKRRVVCKLCAELSTLTTQNAELAQRLEEAIKRIRLITNICEVCWTNSFEPCDKNEKDAVAIPTVEGDGFMHCTMCKLKDEYRIQHDQLAAALADSRRLAVAAKAHIQARYNFEAARADYNINPTEELGHATSQASCAWSDTEEKLETLITAAMSAQH